MVVFPNAKLNLGLNIVEKRTDGFHNIETVFYPINLSDILEINKSDKLNFCNTGLSIENNRMESNLCYKAYQLLYHDYNIGSTDIHLHKIIPFGAGIGGGSADASFTLQVLNSLFGLKLSQGKLNSYAEKIGSDCPFFLMNKPAFASGKGNILTEIELNLKGYFLVLIHPGIHVSTALAYSKTKPKLPGDSLKALIKEPIENWRNTIKNDFEEPVFEIHPALKNIKKQLYNEGAVFASMSGSGSAIYGIFKEKADIKNTFANYFVWQEWL